MNVLEDNIMLELARVIKSYKLDKTLNQTSFTGWLEKASTNILGRTTKWLSIYLSDPAAVQAELSTFNTKAKKAVLKQRMVAELSFIDPDEAAFVVELMFPKLIKVVTALMEAATAMQYALDCVPYKLTVTTQKGTGKPKTNTLTRGDPVNEHEAWSGSGLKLKVEEIASELTWKLMKGTTKLATTPYTGKDIPAGPWTGTTKVQVQPAV